VDFDWIENNVLLHALNEGERLLLGEVFDIVEFEVGDNLITQGHNEKDMFIIREGMAAITYLHREMETQVGFAESGAIVGEMSFFRKQPAAATVRAMGPIRAYKFTRQAYCKLLVVNPEVLMNLLAYIQLQTAQALERSNHQLASMLVERKSK
jgi:CRP-like cAMP-binding protein